MYTFGSMLFGQRVATVVAGQGWYALAHNPFRSPNVEQYTTISIGMLTHSYFAEIVFAGIGGLLVVMGLLLEHFSDKEWYEYKCLPERRRKELKFFGEWFVILGVFLEFIVACVTANGEWQIKKQIHPTAIFDGNGRFVSDYGTKRYINKLSVECEGGVTTNFPHIVYVETTIPFAKALIESFSGNFNGTVIDLRSNSTDGLAWQFEVNWFRLENGEEAEKPPPSSHLFKLELYP